MQEIDEEANERPATTPNIWIISISSSLVASIVFLILFQPIINWLSKSAFDVFSSVGNVFFDQIYQQAAMGIERAVLGLISMFLFIGAINVAMFPIVLAIVKRYRRKAIRNNPVYRAPISGISSKVSIALSSLSVAYIVVVFISVFICIQASTTFDTYMRASSAHMSDEQIRKLTSRWDLMNGRSEYVSIIDDIEKMAEDGQWNLPRRLI